MSVPRLRFKEFGEEWEEKKIKQFVQDKKGSMKIGPFGSQLQKSSFVKKGFKVYGQENIFINDFSFGDRYITSEHFNKLKTNELFYNDFVISTMGTIGKCAIVPENIQRGVMDSHLIRLQLNEKTISPTFLSQVFGSFLVLKQVKNLSVGGIMDGLSMGIINELKFCIPILDEQTKIANFFTAIDEKITQLTQKHDLLKQYKKGLMQQIFSQQLRFKDDDGREFAEWEEKKLADVLDIVIDNRGKTPPIESNGYPLLEVNAIGNKHINYRAVTKFVTEVTYRNWFRKHLKRSDVLFSTVGGTAQCSFYEEEHLAVIAQNIVGLRFKINYLGLFMFYLLTDVGNNRKFKKIEMIAVQPSIKVSQMIHLFFCIPSLPEQSKIANFLTAIDDKITHTQTQLNAVKQYKKGLLQQMFV